MNKTVSDAELIKTIADFIEMGHIENILAMFKQEKDYYKYTGELIKDERFMVRMGIVVLFEELAKIRENEIAFALPSLLPVLEEKKAFIRGEAVTLLGIIGTKEAEKHIRRMKDDPDPQVREIVADLIG